MGSPPSLFGAAVEPTVAGSVWGEKEVEMGGGLVGHVGVVFSTPGRGQGSSASASILLLCLTALWIQD